MEIVLFSTADWDNPFWTNKQHVATELAKIGHKVLYIDSVGLRSPSIKSKGDYKRIVKRLKKGLSLPKKVKDNIWVWSPLAIPYRQFGVVNFINRLYFLGALGFLRFVLNFNFKDILWTYSPITGDYFDLKSFRCVLYHCVDEIKFQPGMPIDLIEKKEFQLCLGAKLIFTTSLNLYNSKKKINHNTFYHPNVADFDHFNSATSFVRENKFKRPTIGFIGAISQYKLDFNLIKKVCLELNEFEFIFGGKIGEGDPTTNIDKLKYIPNLNFIGPVDYEKLPELLSSFDVCIIPSALNPYTENMFPMKFFEYLSARKPIVTTAIPALKEFSDFYFESNDSDEFCANIKRALKVDEDFLNKGIILAMGNTYELRTKEMLRKIELLTEE